MMTHVMIVESHAPTRRTLSSTLAELGFGVSTASDVARARQLAEVAPPEIALVDVPRDGGIELVRALKRRFGRAIYVAAMTKDDDVDVRAACLAAGADMLFVKPIAIGELRKQLVAATRA